MMKIVKKIPALLLALLLTLSMVPAVRAAYSNVIYMENADEFIFLPGSDYSDSDLFLNFKDVMPGDTISQQIVLINDASARMKIMVYMRSRGAHEDSVDVLSQMKLRVENETDTVLFEAGAHETAQLTEWTYLGTLYSGGEVVLDATLEVPVTMDNQFQEQVGYLDWEFRVEQMLVAGEVPEPPETGDETPVLLYGGLMAASCLGLILVLIPRRKKEEQEDC